MEIRVETTFPWLSLESLNSDPEYKAQFEKNYTSAVVAAAGVQPTQVTILGVFAGSVVVRLFTIGISMDAGDQNPPPPSVACPILQTMHLIASRLPCVR
jgi:hypothetical protein